MPSRRKLSDGPARVAWLLAHRHLWQTTARRSPGPVRDEIVSGMKRDGLIAPSTNAVDCRVDVWLDHARVALAHGGEAT